MDHSRDTVPAWQDLLKHAAAGDHLVQLYQDEAFLAEAVGDYAAAGLRAGEAVLLVVTPEHRRLFLRRLDALGVYPDQAQRRGQLRVLDAAAALEGFMQEGRPRWRPFQQGLGGILAELRGQYPALRLYGEMVDVLWREGRREAATELEDLWNRLGAQHAFSLLCAYRMDNLDGAAYEGPLQCVCRSHTHLIPARDYSAFNHAVTQASKAVLDQPLAQMLLSLSASHRPPIQMPLGQATLIWLKKNMPRTADKVLLQVRALVA